MSLRHKFTNNTQIVGIIGHPIKHSLSPLMHNISFELDNLNYIYLSFDVPSVNLKTALKGMVALGIRGFNITLPHKEKIIQYLSHISEEASVIGAVNTVVNENGILHGYNTDVHGIIESLNPYKDDIADSNVVVFGAGGAARSVIYALIRYFKIKSISIVNRTDQKSESLKDYFSTKMHFNSIKAVPLIQPDLGKLFNDSKLIINTTSVGLSPNDEDSIITTSELFKQEHIVFDLIYIPAKTKFLQLAEEKNAITINGLKMFIHQGSKSFELWTGQQMQNEKLAKAIKVYLEN